MSTPSLPPQLPIDSEDASASLSLADVSAPSSCRSLPFAGSPDSDPNGISNRSIQSDPYTDDFSDVPVQPELAVQISTDSIMKVGTPEEPNTKRRSPLRACLLVSLLVATVALIVGISVGVAVSNKNEKDAQSNVGNPSTSTTVNERPMYDTIVSYLVSQGVSDETALQTEGTPQYSAARWLSEQDEARVQVPTVPITDASDSSGYRFITRYIMALNYFAWGGDGWRTSLRFLTNHDVCDWNGDKFAFNNRGELHIEGGGVWCDTSNLPIYLDLEFDQLRGNEIPTEIGLLSTLQLLDLETNYLEASIPTEICHLDQLQLFLVTLNDLYGEIPDCMRDMTNLRAFHAELNQLSGEIPSGVCGAINMTSFITQRNDLIGTIPDCIGDSWSNLETFIVSENTLTSSIPLSFKHLKHLKNLWVDDNEMSGDPIATLNKLTNLRSLYLENNGFSGNVHDFGWEFDHLRTIDMSNNEFTSSSTHALPGHLLELPELRVLDLSKNLLQGHLPIYEPENSNLWFLSMHENQINGTIPNGLKKLTNLYHLDLSNNEFTGPLKSELFEIPSLNTLFVAENDGLDPGPVPEEVSNMTQLVELSLRNTNREGSLPDLVGFDQLILLDLDTNDFTGAIPAHYGSLPRLRHLLLNRNPDLSGDLPTFSGMDDLQTVLLDATNVKGDYSSICLLNKYAPSYEPSDEDEEEAIIVADCSDQNDLGCPCCHCCPVSGDEGCSDPYVASLDWTWELQNSRLARDFAINQTHLIPPDP